MTEKSAFELHLEKLKLEYQKQLPGKLKKIDTDWQTLQKHWQIELMAILHRDVHSLIGSSGTFGFHDVSKSARELEIILKPLEHQIAEFKLDNSIITQINHQLTQLKKTVADAIDHS